MNRRALVISSGLAAIALFGGGAFLFRRSINDSSVIAPMTEDSQFVRPHSPVLGPLSAPVTIVEFFDPSCEACRAFYPFVKQIMAAYPQDVRLVLRYTPFHPASEEAIRILEAARKQDKFTAVLESLLEKQEEWGADGAPKPERAWEIAGEAGLDLGKAREHAASADVDGVLKQDVADVKAIKITGTPTFFVNGKPLTSFGPEQLAALVKTEVEAAK
jgi:protein-disulfide isomerase